jgi:hypothetical protein
MAVHSWWWQVRRRARPRRTPRPPVTSHVGPEVADSPRSPTSLTMPQLCALWRKSRAGLRFATSPEALVEVVMAREVLLDELERREPEAMAEWLDAGAVEPEGPSDYLLREARPGR